MEKYPKLSAAVSIFDLHHNINTLTGDQETESQESYDNDQDEFPGGGKSTDKWIQHHLDGCLISNVRGRLGDGTGLLQ